MLRSNHAPLDKGLSAANKTAVSTMLIDAEYTIQALEDGALHDLDADNGNTQ